MIKNLPGVLFTGSPWKAIDQRPFLAGCFIWTGFDYRGEPTPYTWPSAGLSLVAWINAASPRPLSGCTRRNGEKDTSILQLVPHWNWPADSIGKKIRVMALSNADSVKILLNGKSLDGQAVDHYEMNTWMIPYQPGKLEAIGYKNGKIVSRFKRRDHRTTCDLAAHPRSINPG